MPPRPARLCEMSATGDKTALNGPTNHPTGPPRFRRVFARAGSLYQASAVSSVPQSR